MKRKIVQVIALTLVISIAIAACGDPEGVTAIPAVSAEQPLGTIMTYVAEPVSFDNKFTHISNLTVFEGSAFFLGAEKGSVRPYSLDLETKSIAALAAYAPPDAPEHTTGEIYALAMTLDNAGELWVVESVYMALAGDDDGFYTVLLRALDKTGAELSRFDITRSVNFKDSVNISSMEIDMNGNIYLFDAVYGINVFSKDFPCSLMGE